MNNYKQINLNLCDELDAARRQLKYDQKSGIAALDNIYRRGIVPNQLLNGRYWGEFLASNFHPVLDNLLDIITKIWLPWEGKKFDAQNNTGDNIFTNDGLLLGRLIWPFYNGYVVDSRGRSLAFKFQSSLGRCLLEPDIEVLRLNFDLPGNPQFLIRDLVDQLVQIDDDFYLGKAVLKHPEGGWFCAAYFTLSSGLVTHN
ncbi:hypothetical protein IQ259_14030 [Fortiea sp. LEGE XX443]|uniref:hypothetical protein n=1 Tax=Fortiea sp. LEGE XX443 TaxID=1828611 RepID=UPI001881A41B|nr:hypothetical protein [Fortiea sp. LEGE XX443]MBE9006140.1 hypothetical protein [Fortiea sp. LEGE XX443]